MSETFTHDKLIGGDFPIVTESLTLLDGQTVLRGGILGKITAGTVPSEGTLAGTGNGTLTVVTGGVNVQAGTYTVLCIEAVTNGGVFAIKDPNGKIIGTTTVAVGAGGTAVFTTDELNGTITEAGTDFALDDVFSVVVPAGSGKTKLIDSTAVDGSAHPYSVSSEASAPSGADAVLTGYLTGQFNTIGLSVGGSDTVAQHVSAMRALSMYVRVSIPE